MNLLKLIKTFEKNPQIRLLLNAAGSALSTTVVVAIVSYAAKDINDYQQSFVNVPLALLFIGSLFAYMYTEIRLVSDLGDTIEKAIHKLRMKLVERIRHAELWKLEKFGQTRLYESISQNSKIITSNSQYIAQAIRSLILIIMLLIYMSFISFVSVVFISITLVVASLIYYKQGQSLEKAFRDLGDHEGKLFNYISDLFDGFKEQRLCSKRSNTICEEFTSQSQETVNAHTQVYKQTWEQFVFGETTFNIMIGAVIFIVPGFSSSVSDELIKISAAVLFMGTPIFGLMQSLAILRSVETAAGRMMDLEKELKDFEEEGSNGKQVELYPDFKAIELEEVEFSFPAAKGEIPFSIGPIDLKIKRGEVVFISGGNGSGKSTFIKILTGLYKPKQGRIKLDGATILPNNIASYRLFIAPVFSDFFLFSQLYGISEKDLINGDDLLLWMEMEKIVEIKDGKFSRTDLSGGQRKRIALISALLEKKPILVLDEWAADQDSYFRKKFYTEIIPELKKRGLTIIAVTHDDRYFDASDRRLHIDEGIMKEVQSDLNKGSIGVKK